MDEHAPLLPVSGKDLRGDPRLAESVRRISVAHGADHFDDTAVSRVLEEHRSAVRRAQGGPAVWLGSIALTVGLVWLLWALLAPGGRPDLEEPRRAAAALGAPVLPLVLGTAGIVVAYRRGRRALRHPVFVGYRQVLAAARAHGVPVTNVPDWLTGSTGGGRAAAPLPAWPVPDEARAPAAPFAAATPPASVPAGVPPKPAEVAEYERLAGGGGWHDEAGWILLAAGAVAIGWAVMQRQSAGYAGVLLAALGVWAWSAGAARGRRERELRPHAVTYVRRLREARHAGVAVPELSGPLRDLFQEE